MIGCWNFRAMETASNRKEKACVLRSRFPATPIGVPVRTYTVSNNEDEEGSLAELA